MDRFPLLRLPMELIIHVLSLAAFSSFDTALMLALVSSTVRHLTAPALYNTLILRSEQQVVAFANVLLKYSCSNAIKNGNDALRLHITPGPHVRNLCISHHAFANFRRHVDIDGGKYTSRETDNEHPYAIIFRSCTRVRKLALQATFLHSSIAPWHPVHQMEVDELMVLGPTFPSDWVKHADVASAVASTRAVSALRRSGERAEEWSVAYQHPSTTVLRHVTRLRLSEPLSSPQYSGLHVARLPNLTHLAIPIHEPTHLPNPLKDLDALLDSINRDSDTPSDDESDGSDSDGESTRRSRSRLEQIVVILDFCTWVNKKASLTEWLDRARKKDKRLCVVVKEKGEPWEQWNQAVGAREDIWEYARRVCA